MFPFDKKLLLYLASISMSCLRMLRIFKGVPVFLDTALFLISKAVGEDAEEIINEKW